LPNESWEELAYGQTKPKSAQYEIEVAKLSPHRFRASQVRAGNSCLRTSWNPTHNQSTSARLPRHALALLRSSFLAASRRAPRFANKGNSKLDLLFVSPAISCEAPIGVFLRWCRLARPLSISSCFVIRRRTGRRAHRSNPNAANQKTHHVVFAGEGCPAL